MWGATEDAVADKDAAIVSIHAPVWGATDQMVDKLREIMFQSTHPCGVRPYWQNLASAFGGFNPRTRVGCDKCGITSFSANFVSIHAPVWGATGFRVIVPDDKNVSIHAPVWGATLTLDVIIGFK